MVGGQWPTEKRMQKTRNLLPQGLKKVPGFGFQRLCGSFRLTQKGKMLTMRFHAVLSGEPEEMPLVVSCTSLKVTLALRAT